MVELRKVHAWGCGSVVITRKHRIIGIGSLERGVTGERRVTDECSTGSVDGGLVDRVVMRHIVRL